MKTREGERAIPHNENKKDERVREVKEPSIEERTVNKNTYVHYECATSVDENSEDERAIALEEPMGGERTIENYKHIFFE
jgi:hypothetical protein